MNNELVLYRHVKRPEWGLSTIVSLEDDRTTFLFVDGLQRTFKRMHVHFMELVTVFDETVDEAQRKLATFTRSTPTGTVLKAKAKKPKAKPKPKPVVAEAAPAADAEG